MSPERPLPWGVTVRFGVLACVHGDFVALERVIAGLEGRGVFRFWHLGDLLGEDPQANFAILEKLKCLRAEGIQGHVESEWLQRVAGESTAAVETIDKADVSANSQFLRTSIETLPSTRVWKIGGVSVFACHGSPRQIDEGLGASTRDHFLAKMGRRAATDILVYGHTHKAYVRDVGGQTFMNAGSVAPVDGKSTCGIIAFGARTAAVEILEIEK